MRRGKRAFSVELGWQEVFGLRKSELERIEFRHVRYLCIHRFDRGDEDKKCYGQREDGVSYGHFGRRVS